MWNEKDRNSQIRVGRWVKPLKIGHFQGKTVNVAEGIISGVNYNGDYCILYMYICI